MPKKPKPGYVPIQSEPEHKQNRRALKALSRDPFQKGGLGKCLSLLIPKWGKTLGCPFQKKKVTQTRGRGLTPACLGAREVTGTQRQFLKQSSVWV